MTSIRVMPPELAAKIAAGEVVERPAAAVKELIDNAIDAGARRVRIDVRDAGLKLIRVTDDGAGIPRADLPLAFLSHATSKISLLGDLTRIATLGFRGEALYSIAAVSRVEVQTRDRAADVGTRYRVEFGEPGEVAVCSAPPGTRVSVSDLFANVPARRKFVRSLRSEAGQIHQVVLQYALARPSIAFRLGVDERSTFQSPGTGRLADALAAVYGADVAAEVVEILAEEDAVRVEGLVSTPALTRPNRGAIHLFVNGRPIQNRSLGFALEEAYRGFLMTGRHPLAAVHLTVGPEDLDPNIHPSKAEIRFAREREVHAALHRAVTRGLLNLRVRDNARTLDGDDLTSGTATDTLLPLPSSKIQQPDLVPAMPALRVFGQMNTAFIIAEGPNGLYMIDQHAAHERVLFDRLDQQLGEGDLPTQPLLEPVTLDLQPSEMKALDENGDLLIQAGFVLEAFGASTCLIRSVPALAGSPVSIVRDVLTELANLSEPAAARERALAAMACRAAVKAGQTLDPLEMRELVTALEQTPRPATCPHGRPTMIHVSHSRLEREFGRR